MRCWAVTKYEAIREGIEKHFSFIAVDSDHTLLHTVKHSFEGLYEQMSAVLAGRPAARAGLIIRIRAETVAI